MDAPTAKKRKSRGCLIAAAICLLLIGILWYSWPELRGTSPTAAGAPISGLPAGARDVRWVLPAPLYPNIFYSFATTEKAFHEWALRVAPKGGESGEGDFTILTGDPRDGSIDEQRIADAVFYAWEEEDRGTYVAYDRQQGRAYYHHHTR